MFDIKLLRENPGAVREALVKRNAAVDLDAALGLDAQRRKALYEMEQIRAEQNRTSAEIAKKKRAGEDASELQTAMKDVSDRIKALDNQVREVDAQLQEFLLTIPNMPDASLPTGKDSSSNRLERQ